ncbi:MAG: MFS transporter [Hyphomicrobium sp.]|nr:MAG: MFS transporter [Hyphomicrobium sp.]MBZ0209695.1 MFS transporter [Hyphomicrobium sp.]
MQPLSWDALFALLLAVFAISVGYGIVLPILPYLVDRISGATDPATSPWHTGLITGTYILAIFLFAPFWGKISDRWGRRPVLLTGLTGFAASVALFARLESIPLVYLGRFFDGVFAAAIVPAAYALIGDHAPSKEWRAHRFALIGVAGMLGFFVGPILGGLVLGTFKEPPTEAVARAFSVLFLATSALALIAALAIWRLVPRPVPGRQRRIAATNKHSDWSVMLRLWAIAFVTAVAVGAFEVGLSLRGRYELGMDASQIGRMFAACSLVMFAAQALIFSPLVKPDSTRWLFTPGVVTLALGLLAVPLATSDSATTAAVALVAASAGLLSPIVTYWVSLGAGETQGADLGWATAAASLGQALGSAAGGLLFGVTILPGAAFTVTAVVVLSALVASFGLAQRLHGTGPRGAIASVPEARASQRYLPH